MQFTLNGWAAAALVPAFALLTGSLSARDEQEPGPASDVRSQYLALCAACHGENGDGKGTTELDRQPRSFVDGGFSYGNTQSAIVRALTFGIPGTPMPSFDPALSEADRARMADYVISLGPERREVDPKKTVVVVGTRPVIVRGFLPPIAEGAKQQTRGLLIGTTSGTTFEYRVDDVRLLGLRQGEFVERRDWGGRGGDPLLPLGKVVHLFDGGAPGATFRLRQEGVEIPLVAKLRSTFVRGDEAGLEYALHAGDEMVAHVTESVRSIGTSLGGGFGRKFVIETFGRMRTLMFDTAPAGALPISSGAISRTGPGSPSHQAWAALPDTGGLTRYVQITSDAKLSPLLRTQELIVTPDRPRELDVATIIVAAWDVLMRDTLAKELDQ